MAAVGMMDLMVTAAPQILHQKAPALPAADALRAPEGRSTRTVRVPVRLSRSLRISTDTEATTPQLLPTTAPTARRQSDPKVLPLRASITGHSTRSRGLLALHVGDGEARPHLKPLAKDGSTDTPLPAVRVCIASTPANARPRRRPASRLDLESERLLAIQRIAEHRGKIDEANRLKDAADVERRSRYAYMDVDALRLQAGQRASEATRCASQRAEEIAQALDEQKKGVQAKRAMESQQRERRRQEIYALNRIMRDYYRGLGAID